MILNFVEIMFLYLLPLIINTFESRLILIFCTKSYKKEKCYTYSNADQCIKFEIANLNILNL